MQNCIVIEEASLELVPRQIQNHNNCKSFEAKFGVPPDKQILDDNFHNEAMVKLDQGREKRGRPDLVHFALLEVTSTPLYLRSKVAVGIHTIRNTTIMLKEGVRIPRTLHRFNGMASKILRGEMGQKETDLFTFDPSQTLNGLISELDPSLVVSLTKVGKRQDLREFVANVFGSKRILWMVGGFAFGHFSEKVVEASDHLIAISKESLPSHVVTARLTYELERSILGPS